MKGFLTTTKLAEIAGVSQPTILDAITKKTIYAIRTPGGHYRIPQEEASRFLFAQGADPKRLARKSMRILHFTGDPEQAVAVAAAVGGIDRCKLEVANNPFKAGVLLEKFVPDILILGMEDSRIEEEVLEHLVRDMGDTRPKILLLRRDVGALQGD
ncbi:MAG: excisionase family DNA-binding protein, partial [Planctomycetota bacterium]